MGIKGLFPLALIIKNTEEKKLRAEDLLLMAKNGDLNGLSKALRYGFDVNHIFPSSGNTLIMVSACRKHGTFFFYFIFFYFLFLFFIFYFFIFFFLFLS
jgi:hypothetical protein